MRTKSIAARCAGLSRSRLVLCAFLCSWAIANTSAAAPMPDQIRSALEANAKAISPLQLSWQKQSHSRMSLEELMAAVHETNGALFKPAKITYVVSGPRFYHHDEYYSYYSEGSRSMLQRQHTSFDGKKITSGSDNAGRRNAFMIDTPQHLLLHKIHPDARWFDVEYFDAAGIQIGDLAGTLFDAPKSQILQLIERGGEATLFPNEPAEGYDCAVIGVTTSTMNHRYWLAPELGDAVVLHEERNSDGKLLVRTRNSDFTELREPRLWLPKRSEVAYHSWHTAPELIEEEPLIVTDFNVTLITRDGIRDSQFSIDTTRAGSVVGDSTIDGEKDADGFVNLTRPESMDLEQIHEKGARSSRLFWLLAVNATLFVVGTIWLLVRRYRSPRS